MNELKEENSYGNILKRLSAFGGVQIFNILIGLVRGKFVAMFLGPAGMGISSLYASSTATIQQISSLGLNLAIVKEIASSTENKSVLRQKISLCLRLLLATSILGALICGAGSFFWSDLTFGNFNHSTAYIFLSLFVALSIAGAGFMALLQGLGEVKRLSKASLVGGATGLIFGVPLYYFFGDGGIVPAMIILALAIFLFYSISFRKAALSLRSFPIEEISKQEQHSAIKRLLSLGLILLAGSLAGQIVSYLINLFVRYEGSVSDVGFYQGAASLTNQYVGLIISALALDYFPRLSACASERGKMKVVVNRQIEIVMLVATPLLILLILSSPLIIKLLLTASFETIVPLMKWMGAGMLIQVLAFPFGYIYVACEDKKAYIWLECIWTNVCWLGCSIGFYHWFGLIGLGISLVVRNIIDLIINLIIIRKRYGFTFTSDSIIVVIISIILTAGAFITSFISKQWISYSLMILLFCASATISVITLKRKISKQGAAI